MTTTGIDYSFARPSSPAAVKAAGYSFVCRYVGGSKSKDLTPAEAKALIAAGLTIVTNWEGTTGAALNGRSQGVTDAKAALAQATADGMPAGRPIYFSFDEDPRPLSAAQWAAVEGYYQGVASVLGVARTGAYGGLALVTRLLNKGLIRWAWQTYAWSGGAWDSRAQLRQVQNGITVAGADSDRDQAMVTDFGQWPIKEDNMEALRDDRDFSYLYPRVQAIAHLNAPLDGPEKGANLELVAAVKRIDTNAAAAAAAAKAPVPVTLTDEQLQTISANVTTALSDQLTALSGKVDQLINRLAAAGDALDGTPAA